jgi:hypothetical protein
LQRCLPGADSVHGMQDTTDRVCNNAQALRTQPAGVCKFHSRHHGLLARDSQDELI